MKLQPLVCDALMHDGDGLMHDGDGLIWWVSAIEWVIGVAKFSASQAVLSTSLLVLAYLLFLGLACGCELNALSAVAMVEAAGQHQVFR
jgi:hypothetical protein